MTQSLSSGHATCTQLHTRRDRTGSAHWLQHMYMHGLHPSLHHTCVFLCFYCTWKTFLSKPYASWFMPREKCPAFKANWLMSPVEHIWYLYQQNWAVSLICEGRVRGTREAQTFLGGTCCLRLTDCHINKAQNLSFSGWHPEIWDTH